MQVMPVFTVSKAEPGGLVTCWTSDLQVQTKHAWLGRNPSGFLVSSRRTHQGWADPSWQHEAECGDGFTVRMEGPTSIARAPKAGHSNL